MIEHVYRRSCLASNSDKVVLAICEEKLEETCKILQMDYVMTDHKQPTALDRVGEAARLLGYTDLRCCHQCSWGRADSTSSGD